MRSGRCLDSFPSSPQVLVPLYLDETQNLLWRQLTWPLNSRYSTHGRLSQLTAQDMTAGMKIHHRGVTGVKGGRTPALQYQEDPEEEDRTDNSKAFQKGIKPGQRATPKTVSDQSLATDVGKRAINAQTAQGQTSEVTSTQTCFNVAGKKWGDKMQENGAGLWV